MLEPDDRRHLLEALRPPEGHRLTHAVGTTYSLDLLTLLTVPLAFSLFDWETEQGEPTQNPLALLEALRRHAGDMLIFCQVGGIHASKNVPLLVANLETSIVEVQPPGGQGVFHPKMWVLRYSSGDSAVRYRLLCSSRNLTFDRSWDTLLALEGELEDRVRGFGENRPLADFLAALPRLALRPVPTESQSIVDLLADEVRRVRFEAPLGFEGFRFWPLGIDGHKRWPFPDSVRRMLVVSPFLSPNALDRLSLSADEAILVSRLEELQRLSRRQLSDFSKVYTLAQEADLEPDENLSAPGPVASPPSGLHTKLYVADVGRESRVWTGSANATVAAFGQNVEFLVELVGRRSACGVDRVLGQEKGHASLVDLLEEYKPPKDAVPEDPDQVAVDALLETTRRSLAEALPIAKIDIQSDERFTLSIRAKREGATPLSTDASIYCWPITLPESRAVGTQVGREIARFDSLTFPALTPFVAFRIEAAANRRRGTLTFVLNLPLEGAPADRQERVLRHLLKDRDQVLRLLLLLLADVDEDPAGWSELGRLLLGESDPATLFQTGALLEPLLRALVRDPGKLDEVHRLAADLHATEEGTSLLPEGFDAIWKPIWAARQELPR